MASFTFFSRASILYYFLFSPVLIMRKLLLSPSQEVRMKLQKHCRLNVFVQDFLIKKKQFAVSSFASHLAPGSASRCWSGKLLMSRVSQFFPVFSHHLFSSMWMENSPGQGTSWCSLLSPHTINRVMLTVLRSSSNNNNEKVWLRGH